MTAERVTPAPGERGRVVRVEVGVVIVDCDGVMVRASYSGRMLARIARDSSAVPVPGDGVRLCHWPDKRVTVEERYPVALAKVVPLHT